MCFVDISVNVRANSKDGMTTEEMRKLIERSVRLYTQQPLIHTFNTRSKSNIFSTNMSVYLC